MKKAYDFQNLIERFKASGLENAEELARDIYNDTMNWVTESAAISETPLDDLAVPFRKQVDAVVLPQIDKVDNQVG